MTYFKTLDELGDLSFYAYSLCNGRFKGLLLKGTRQTSVGYSCLHSWPELGDPTIESFKNNIRDFSTHPLLLASLRNLELDLNSRAKGLSLFSGKKLSSHFQLIKDLAEISPHLFREKQEQGFHALKIKIKKNHISTAADQLNNWTGYLGRIKLRLDLNASLSKNEFETFLKRLNPELLDAIDYIEDPLPLSPGWEEIQSRYRLRLAADFERPEKPNLLPADSCDVIVLKPARDSLSQWIEYAHTNLKRISFSSYLQHPIGQTFDYFHAQYWSEQHPLLVEDAGFLNDLPSEMSPFKQNGPQFWLENDGPGIGFTSYLEKLTWQTLL